MNLESIFRDKLKPELNFLYTERPSDRPDGTDFGWFCKEHAYHGLLVAKAMGCKAEIRRGHVFVLREQGKVLSPHSGKNAINVWLSINETRPVDLSLTLKYLAPDLPRIDIVYGQGPRGAFTLAEGKVASVTLEIPLWRALSGEFEEHQRAGRGGSKIR